MIGRLTRREGQVLRLAGHALVDVATLSGMSMGAFRWVVDGDAAATADHDADRSRRQIGRPLLEVPNHEL